MLSVRLLDAASSSARPICSYTSCQCLPQHPTFSVGLTSPGPPSFISQLNPRPWPQAAREQEEAARRTEEARKREVERLQREMAEEEAEEVRAR